MEHACDEAIACGQWDRVFRLLQDGLSPSEEVVEELCGNMMERVAALYPDHTMTSGLRGRLLVGAVKHGQGDAALHVIHHQSVSDTEVMEVIRLAVHLRDKETLLQLLTRSPRCRRVFKHKFDKEQWKEGAQGSECDDDSGLVGELGWIFDALCKHGEDDLAVHIAATKASEGKTEFLLRFLTLKPKATALTWRKLRNTLGKLHSCNQPAFRDAVHALCDRSKDDVSRLFREVLRLRDVIFASSLIGYGVQRKDLKFALPWIMLHKDVRGISSFLDKLNGDDKIWLRHCATRYALAEYFKESSRATLLTFIYLFEDSCFHKNDAFLCNIFWSAIAKSVKQDDPQCFAKVLTFYFGRCLDLSKPGATRDDCKRAIMKPLKKQKYNFIKVAGKEMARGVQLGGDSLLEVMVEAVFENKAWVCLPSLYAGTNTTNGSLRENVLDHCLQEMLTNKATWQSCGKAFNLCLKEDDLGDVGSLIDSVRKKTLNKQWPVSVATVAQWCLAESHSNLAVLLGFVLADWQLVGAALSQPSLDLHESFLIDAVGQAITERAFSTGVTLMKLFPLTRENIYRFQFCKHKLKIAELCEAEGLHDWALVLSADHMTASSIRDKLRACQSQEALTCLLQDAADRGKWDIAKELLVRHYDDPFVIENVLLKAVHQGKPEVLELLIERVDAKLVREDAGERGGRSLLYWAADYGIGKGKRTSLELVRICITSGLSTFQRDEVIEEYSRKGHNCPLRRGIELRNFPVVRLILKSGALPNSRLYEERLDWDMDRMLKSAFRSKTWKTFYRMIMAAAANPRRLEHLARLTVSHTISCQPGRQERIKALPVPECIKDLIRFKDILSLPSMEEEQEEVVGAGTLQSDIDASDTSEGDSDSDDSWDDYPSDESDALSSIARSTSDELSTTSDELSTTSDELSTRCDVH